MNEFKSSKEFHESFENTLNKIEQMPSNHFKKRMFYKIAAIAASVAIIGAVAVFSADAAGVINLNSAFEKYMGIENDDRSKELVQKISSPQIDAQVTVNGITAKVVQSVNDDYAGNIMVELTANEKILNPNMSAETMLSIPGVQLRAVTSFVVSQWDYSAPKTIEEYAKEMEGEQTPLSDEEQAYYNSKEYIDKMNKEYIGNYNNSFTDKIYVFVNFQSEGKVSNKKIDLTINGLTGYKNGENYKEESEKVIDAKWNLTYTAAANAPSEKFVLNKDINGVPVKDVTISPISFVMTLNKPINVNDENDETYSKTFFAGVRYKDGRTQYIPQGSGSYGRHEISTSLAAFVDVENLESIFLGNNYTEVRLEK